VYAVIAILGGGPAVFGTQDQEITVGPNQTVTENLDFKDR
jgi:hypothetical protein